MGKITFKNGTSIDLPESDSPEAGKGLNTHILDTYNDFDQTLRQIVAEQAMDLLQEKIDKAMESKDYKKAHELVDLKWYVLGLYNPEPIKMGMDFGKSGGDASIEVIHYRNGDITVSTIKKINIDEIEKSWENNF